MLDTVIAVGKPCETKSADGENQTEKVELIVLKGGFSTSDHSYKFEIESDGTGEIFYSDFEGDSEEFAHEVKVEELAANIEKAINEQITLQREENALEDGEAENIR